jgi:cell division septation protein DedD
MPAESGGGSQWTSVPGIAVQPALAPGSGVMVQVAAVSHLEDATVLMGALRKRGYAVTARHAPEDELIHVQVGPFASRADANAMSQKLLSDGYNAVVLP